MAFLGARSSLNRMWTKSAFKALNRSIFSTHIPDKGVVVSSTGKAVVKTVMFLGEERYMSSPRATSANTRHAIDTNKPNARTGAANTF